MAREGDTDADALTRRRIGILGYGVEARAQALRLRDQGNDVTVAVRPGGMSWVRAMSDGFRPCHVAEAVVDADVVVVLIPEAEQPAVYSISVAPNLKPGALVVFGHASAVHARALEPSAGVDVVLVTARLAEQGVQCLVAVYRDETGSACERAIAYARAAYGSVAASVGTTSFAEETEREIADQAALSGGVAGLLAAWERLLTSSGHEPNEARLSYYEHLRSVVSESGVRHIPSPPSSHVSVARAARIRFRMRQRGAA